MAAARSGLGGDVTHPGKALTSVSLTLAIVPLLLSCSAGVADEDQAASTTPWQRPAWMAEQAREQEEYAAALQRCITDQGWNKTVTPEGGVAEPFTDGELERFMTDLSECRVDMGYPAEPSATMSSELLELVYERNIDVVACLEDQGFEMGKPPTLETYIESSLNGVTDQGDWSPYMDPALGALTESDYEALSQACPEPWFPPQ
jgi:hypothetical protein